jgi:hypothetical protein
MSIQIASIIPEAKREAGLGGGLSLDSARRIAEGQPHRMARGRRECETTVRACIALNPKVSVEFCVHLFLVPGRSSHAPLPVARIDVPVVPWRLIDGPATARNL